MEQQIRDTLKQLRVAITPFGMETNGEEIVQQLLQLFHKPPVSGSLPLFSDLIYEQDLPKDITDDEYKQWYRRSYVVDGVRMGYPLQRQ